MDAKQQITFLNKIVEESSDLIDASKAEVKLVNSRPLLELLFEPGICKYIESEKVWISAVIDELPFMDSDISFISFTAYFPYRLKDHNINYKFLLEIQRTCKKEFPFIEIGSSESSDGNMGPISFRCSRLLAPSAAFHPVETLFYTHLLLACIEHFSNEYKNNYLKHI